MVKYKLIVFFIGIFVWNGHSQCADSTGFSLTVSNSASYGNTGCNTAPDINNVKTNEFIYIVLSGWSGTTPTSITWKDNGTTIATYTTNFPESYQLLDSFQTTGNHQISCIYNFTTSCSITKTVNIFVSAQECPYLTASLSDTSMCMYPEDSLAITINTDTSITVLNCQWEVTDQTNNVSVYTSIGDTFYFTPGPGSYTATAVAAIQLNDSVVCYANINGYGCSIDLITNHYSDPFFELQGNFYNDTDIVVVFKGTNNYPPAAGGSNHDYILYLDTTQSGTYINLKYNEVVHTYSRLDSGSYSITLSGEYDGGGCIDSYNKSMIVTPPPVKEAECVSCNTFKPLIEEKYWISAWVKEDQLAQVKNYPNAYIALEFTGSGQYQVFNTTGDIVEGWQRIVGSFVMPTGTTDLKIILKNDNTTVDAYFDDIRIHPFNSSMKSYVYDPLTLWLTAELDDNNYATFYEYDLEGQLIRIKKETARGIMTIQESRSSNPKK